MKRLLSIALSAIATLLLLTACDGQPEADLHSSAQKQLQVVETKFSPDYKTFSVNVKMPAGISSISLTDSTRIRIQALERGVHDDGLESDMQPRLTHIKNVRLQELADNHFSLLLLVDLTLTEEEIKGEREAIQQIRQWFAPSNLHIAFMSNRSVTATMPVTDYVMDNYFKRNPSKTLLYRSILQKREEIAGWTQLKPDQKGLVVFSDGDVYEKDVPVDPDHYALQEQLLRANSRDGYSAVEYVNVGLTYDEGEGNEAKPIMQQLAKNTHGIYQDKFDWGALLTEILSTYHVEYADYQLDFVNPDHKIYVGKKMHLLINVLDGKKQIANGCAEYSIGDVYDPIVVNGLSSRQVILQGVLLTLLCFAVAFLVLLVIVPYVSYQIFKHRYVTHYTNQNMVANGIQVGQSCYYCKAPFEEGDEIVVKCKHVVHKECWDENECRCPEHGRHCKEGSHYYNEHNLFDRRNAPYYARWALVAIVAGLVAWVCFLFFSPRPSGELLNSIMLSIHNLQPGTAEAQEAYDAYAKHLNIMPIFGLCVNLCLTFALSILCHRQNVMLRLQWCVVKALVASLCGYLVFLLVCIVSITLDLEDNFLILDWTPWIVNGFIIAFISAYHTRVRLRMKFLAICGGVAILIMLVWDGLFFDSRTDNRVLLLLCFIVYSVALALSMAFSAPKSERYFLHVEGSIKPMDVALYKWLRNAPGYEVTIGKSVDCNLQMTWDFSPVAPKQATVTASHGHISLTALEDGVTVGDKPLDIGQTVRLYHGRQFVIGQTTFTYIEKDS